jgi:hypothetical protein
MTTERQRLRTPRNATPRTVIAKWWASATASQPAFPAYSRTAWFNSAPNLGKGWRNFPLEQELKSKLDVPVRIVNDADVQGLGAVSGRGDELVITLGTGFGSVCLWTAIASTQTGTGQACGRVGRRQRQEHRPGCHRQAPDSRRGAHQRRRPRHRGHLPERADEPAQAGPARPDSFGNAS